MATPGVDKARRWRGHLAEVYFGLDVRSPDDASLRGGLLKRTLRSVKVSELRGSKQRMIRSSALAKSDKVESYVFISPLDGEFEYADALRTDRAVPGQLFALASAEHHEVAISEEARMVCFEVPAQLVRERGPGIDRLRAGGPFTDPMITSLMRAVGEGALRASTAIDAGSIEKMCLDLIEVAIRSGTRKTIEGCHTEVLHDAVYNRFLQILAKNFRDHRFRLAACAAACGVSERHLQAVMHARSTSFTQEVLNVRLSEAERLIKSTQGPPVAVGRIAELCGFASHTYFSTCYRRRFGVSPREDRLG